MSPSKVEIDAVWQPSDENATISHTMARITIQSKIPSICIDRPFLSSLEKILSVDIEERHRLAKQTAGEKIRVSEAEIRGRTFYSNEAQKDEAVESMKEFEYKLARPHMSISCTIRTATQRLTFTSIAEILQTSLLPDRIESLSVDISHYDTKYVDIDLTLSSPTTLLFMMYGNEYLLSSGDNDKLQGLNSQLGILFDQSKVGYHGWVYPNTTVSLICPFLFSLASAASSAYWSYLFFKHSEPQLSATAFIASAWIIPFLVYLASMSALKWAFPYYEFVFSNRKDVKSQLRFAIGTILLALIASAVWAFVTTA